ncbi:hypothetical protein [Robbsia andropogonis]|uniref:hypothetical protein n=1 Tax=Robbsia andropogonis TaxID=28092 RepID=UPI0020A22368|nr:hypothetical protein [Robbsia andropogonis]MCP1120509.1 hypothetical protein [Robbsia andropogonis]MCP1131290.1 hypothetical protein [Robbsia andropogonis]
MKLAEYIQHLQRLAKEYDGLDIEVVRPDPGKGISEAVCVISANAPEIWPVEMSEAYSAMLITASAPLSGPTKAKGGGPDGVIVEAQLKG